MGRAISASNGDTILGNTDAGSVLTLAAAAVTVQGAGQVNTSAKGVKLVIDITAITGTSPTLAVSLQGFDAASGKWYNILVSAALNAVATTVLTVYPGIVAAANVAANDVLPRMFRVVATIGGTTPAVTATIGANLID